MRLSLVREQKFFNNWAERNGLYEVHPDQEYYRIINVAGITSEDRNLHLLDAGCSSGAFSMRLFRLGFNVTGVDISTKLIESAKRMISKNAEKKLRFYVGDIMRLPFADRSFDIVFCDAILHHLPDNLYECGVEFHRVLKADGKIYFFEPYSRCINSFLWYHILYYDRTKNEKAISPWELQRKFKKAGFTDFHWQKLKKVKHVYVRPHDDIFRQMFGKLRKIFNEIFPNVFFVGSCRKHGSCYGRSNV